MLLTDLPAIERQAIDLLLEGNEDLLNQLNYVETVRRTESGAGVYVTFEVNVDNVKIKENNNFHVSGVFATSESCDEIGFIIFVKNGVLDYLECYVYSDIYPVYSECEFFLSRQVGTSIEK